MISGPAITAVIVTLLATTIALWLLVSGLVSISQPKYFSFTDGCGLGFGIYLVLPLICVYILVDIIFICLLIKGVRDNYGIRYEIFIVSAGWIIFIIVFIILYVVPQYANVYEYQFASGYILLFGFTYDSIVSCTIPCILSFRKRYNNQKDVAGDDLNQVLNNDKHREAFKQYAVASFCPESICKLILTKLTSVVCWEDVQTYNKLDSTLEKLDQIKKILNKYCNHHSILELNLPGHMTDYIKKLSEIAENGDINTVLKPDELELLRQHCEQDLSDVFSRFKSSASGMQIENEKELIKAEDILMQQSGISV
jgi:hypothetical protein